MYKINDKVRVISKHKTAKQFFNQTGSINKIYDEYGLIQYYVKFDNEETERINNEVYYGNLWTDCELELL